MEDKILTRTLCCFRNVESVYINVYGKFLLSLFVSHFCHSFRLINTNSTELFSLIHHYDKNSFVSNAYFIFITPKKLSTC